VSTSVGERAAALGGDGPPDWSPVPERPQSRAAKIGGIVFRAVAAVLVAAFLWSRGHHVAALLLVTVGATLAAASARFPSVSRRVARVERAVEHGAGRVLSVVLIGGVQLLVFTPLSLLLRLLGYNPLALGQSPADPSFWRPALKRPGRPLYRRPFAYDRLPPGQRTRTSRALRIRAALGLIAILALLDIGLGAAIDKLQDEPPAQQANAEVNLLTAPDVAAGRHEPWRPTLGREIAGAWGRKRYDPFLTWRMTEFKGRYVNLTNGVRRSYQPSGATTPGALKVFFFGGSTMFGSFQRDEHTIPSEFARLAEADGIPVRVFNYGQPAYVNWQEVLLLEQLVSGPSRPDLAVFYDGYNEVMLQFSLGRHRRPTQLEAPVIEERLRLGEPESEPSAWTELYNAWTDASAVHRLGRGLGVFAERDEQGEPLRPFWHGDQAEQPVRRGAAAAAVYERGVRLAQGVARRLGFRSAFFWQPSIYTKRVVKGEEGLDAERSADPAAWRQVTRAARARLEPPVVDLGDVLDTHKAPLMYDIVHTNETGARIVAKALYRQLRPQLREELSRR
jgi:hypothetical protein